MGEPGRLKTGYTVIRVDYLNGDYDLLYANAQWFHRDGANQNGYVFFDKFQFDTLISGGQGEGSAVPEPKNDSD